MPEQLCSRMVYAIICRVEDRRGLSHLCAARSANGVDGWKIDPAPTLMPDPDQYPEELWGIEDPRITFVPELQQYAVAYTSYSKGGPGVSLALTKDFQTFERYGVIMPADDKDAALLPHRIGGLWALIHRPMTPLGAHIWISYSPDLRHWGSHRVMMEARKGAWWDANKIGLSSPPIETAQRLARAVPRSEADRLRRIIPGAAWLFLTLKSQKFVCCGAIPGSSDQKPNMSAEATCMTWCFRAGTP